MNANYGEIVKLLHNLSMSICTQCMIGNKIMYKSKAVEKKVFCLNLKDIFHVIFKHYILEELILLLYLSSWHISYTNQ